MGYIGTKPSAVPLTSADITDGIITSAKIADGTIVNADISATAAIAGSKLSGAGFSGATTTSSAVDITLTSASTQVQNISMTAADKAVILPDATTLTTKGFPAFVIINNGVYNLTIRDNGGNIIVVSNPATSTELTLIDNSTSSGVWAKEDATINFKFSPYTTIKTGTSGSPNLSSLAAEYYSGITASAISSTSAIISYHAGTSNRDVYGVVVSYSGSTITVNSETLLYSGSTTASVNSHILMLDATTGFLFVNRASNNVVVPFTISGTTITAGTASSTFGTGSPGNDFSNSLGTPIAMSSTIALVPDRNSTTTATWTLRTITHNGASAPTIGTASSSVTTTDVREPVLISKIDATNAFMAYAVSGTSYAVARVVTISGASAPTLNTANTSSSLQSVVTLGLGLHKISATEFILIGYYRSFNYTVSGTTVSYTGADVANGINNVTPYFVRVAKTLSLGNDALFYRHDGNLTPFTYLKKIGNFIYPAQIDIGFDKYFFASFESTTYQSFVLLLDSSTVLGITNNGGTTISATIIKKT